MSISRMPFGTTPDGELAELFVLKNRSGASVAITNFGGTIISINVPDKDGKIEDVLVSYDTLEGCINYGQYMGVTVGRYANRINQGKFSLNGVDYQLAANSNGHHLHGGSVGFDRKVWQAAVNGNTLALSYTSPDGEENYPGTLRVTVSFKFTDDNVLSINYRATTDKDTICNLTNHAFFNLGGPEVYDILDEYVTVNADTFTVVDAGCIPTGEMRCVEGTWFDLRTPKRVGDGIANIASDEQLTNGNGYDHNFGVNGCGFRFAAKVEDKKSGRVMEVYTDKPGIQLYTGNSMNLTAPGKGGKMYPVRGALCLETQYYPDSINQPSFPSPILKADEVYDFTTEYRFSVE